MISLALPAVVAGRGEDMNDQVVELNSPGLWLLLYSPFAVKELEEGGDYRRRFPDGRDLVDYVNACRFGAIALRFPTQDHWLHLSATMDQSVIARASDHVRLGVEVWDHQLCVRGGDDLFSWQRACPDEQLITLDNGLYNVTACMVPHDGAGPVRIYLHFASTFALPELGYHRVPQLYCETPVR